MPSVAVALLLMLSILTIVSPVNAGASVRSRSGLPAGLTTAAPPAVPRNVSLSAGQSQAVNPLRGYSDEPAPMGIADFGIAPTGPYRYGTNSSLGTVVVDALTTQNKTGDPWMGYQLNVVLEFSNARQTFYYWIQDVGQEDTMNNTIYFVDNIWNFSSPTASMVQQGVLGEGIVATYQNEGYYYDVAPYPAQGDGVVLAYPLTIQFQVNASLNTEGEPQVTFSYNDGFGLVTYDTVAFRLAGHIASMPGFVVDGFNYNPFHLFSDAELIMAGPGGGLSTRDVSSNLTMELEYWNGNNYQSVPNAYNFGGDTGETMSNVLPVFYTNPDNGQPVDSPQAGVGSPGTLYNSGELGRLDVVSPVGEGTLEVSSEADPMAVPSSTGFVDGNATVTLAPGDYDIKIYTNGALYLSDNATVLAGQTVKLDEIPQDAVPLTLSFAVDGEPPASQPTVSYVADGRQMVGLLSESPVTFYVDPGSAWSVSPTILGSNATERWTTTQATSGSASSQQTISFVYHNQVLVSASYSVVAGGSPTAPTLTYYSLGSQTSVALAASATPVWIDGGSLYSVTPTLEGSGSTERWYSSETTGEAVYPTNVTFVYDHQFYLSISGVDVASGWYESGAEADVKLPGTFDRASGTGERVVSYSLDGGASTTVQPTTGTIDVSVTMDSAHQLTVTTVEQYEVTFTPINGSLASITPPTVPGDAYWYDAGTPVQLTFNGVWGRASGTGERLTSYQVDGLPAVSVATTEEVAALDIASISSPQNVTVTATAQYKLTLLGGSVASITPTSIPDDAGWYDSGTVVSIQLDYSWNATAGSRLNAVGYVVGNGTSTILARSGDGTFPVSFTILSPYTVVVNSVAQYRFTYSGGTLSVVSPTGDDFFDQGSNATVTIPDIANQTSDARRLLVSFTLDGSTVNTRALPAGGTTTIPITFDSAQSLALQYVTEYLVGFTFTSASGATPPTIITPSSVQVATNTPEGPFTLTSPDFSAWVESGFTFSVTSIVWEGVNVVPAGLASPTVTAPFNTTIVAAVYPSTVKVTDYFGIAVSGAAVTATLPNGTTIHATTGGDGVAELGLIPQGEVHGTVSYLGQQVSYSQSASTEQFKATLLLSVPFLALLAILAVALIAVSVFTVRRRRKPASGPQPPASSDRA